MGILLAFAPFLAFVLLERLAGTMAGLWAATAISVALLAREVIAAKQLKVLEVGTLLLFAGLALYAHVAQPNWSVIAVRLRVDLGLLVIVLASLALQRPFTLQYAKERVPAEIWSQPEFLRTNYVITAVWAAAFLLMVIAEATILYITTVPRGVGMWVAILAIYGAFRFTEEYPRRKRQPRV